MRRLSVFGFCVLFYWLVMSCGKENNSIGSVPELPTGNIESIGWTVDSTYDYSASMTAVVDVDLLRSYPLIEDYWQLDSADLLGAFCGEECLGVASPNEGLFFLFIHAPAAYGESEDLIITLRYYSAQLKNIFFGNISFPFQNGARQGSIVDPLGPMFYERVDVGKRKTLNLQTGKCIR